MLERLGTHYGGWWIETSKLLKDSIVYSAGVGEDISFDVELIRRFGCTVHGFDPTPRAVAWVAKQQLTVEYVLHAYGLAGFDGTSKFYSPAITEHVSHSVVAGGDMSESYITVPFKRLSTAMKELGHTYIDLLKMDVEGCEYEIIYEITHLNLDVRQIVLEFHRYAEFEGGKVILRLKQAGYAHVKTEGDNYSFVKKSELLKPISIGLTTRCPCRCRYCYPHLKTVDGIDIKEDNFKQIVGILKSEGYNFLHICGYGEPMLHPKVFDFIDLLRENSITSNLITRMSCPIDWKRFGQAYPDRMLVTVDSLKPEVLRNISPGFNPQLARANLDSLAQFHRIQKIHLVFNTTVCSLNYEELPEIESWLSTNFTRDGLGYKISYSGKGMGIGFGCSEPTEIKHALKYARDLWTDKFCEVRCRIEGDTLVPLYSSRCWPEGKICIAVPDLSPGGDLLPCCHDPLCKCVIGNVIEAKTIDGLLKSQKGVAMMEMAKGLLLPICKYCS